MPKRPTLPNMTPTGTGTGTGRDETDSAGGVPEKSASPRSAPRTSPPTSPPAAKAKPETRTAAPAVAAPTGTGRWLRSIHFSAFSLVMMGILVLAVVVLAPTAQAYFQQRQQIADQQAVVDKLTEAVDAATAQRARWNDPSYIRAQARDRLYYVMPGETSYLVIDDRPPVATQDDDPVSSTLQKTHTDWVSSLFGSFMGAGLTEATPQQLTGQPGAPTPAPTPTK